MTGNASWRCGSAPSKLEYRQETVALDALLQEITDTMQQTYPSHSILVHGAVQTSLIGDRDRLAQVFTNPRSYATKQSPHAQTLPKCISPPPQTVPMRGHDHLRRTPREQRA